MAKSLPTKQLDELLQSEERFRTLIEKSTDAIQLLDAEGRIIFSSDSVKTVLGYSPQELAGDNPIDYIHPDDLPHFNKHVHALMSKPGSQIHFEYRVKHKDGSWVWLETTGVNHLDNPSIRALVGNFRDITRRKKYEDALRDSEARLRFMAESMPQKIFTAPSNGYVDYFNPQWSEYTGLSEEEIREKTFLAFMHPDEIDENIRTWEKAVATGSAFEYEHRFRDAKGNYRWHLTRARPMRDDDGNIIIWIGSSTDIEDVKQAKKRQEQLEHRAALLTKQRKQLIELNRIKDEFISLASHQLRTPATGVKQYLGMMLEGYAGVEIPPQLLKMIQIAYDSNERQLKIVNDLLKVASVDAGKVKIVTKECDMKQLVAGVLRDMDSVFEGRDQKVDVRSTCKSCKVWVDSRLMRMVVENIIDNASKYSPAGSTVTLEIACTKKYLNLHVRDTGVGISSQDRGKLFRKFSRIDNELSSHVGGTGLGLYWAKHVVELHNGKIHVDSEPGKGSTFTIKLPLV